jgi:hypothetical protein
VWQATKIAETYLWDDGNGNQIRHTYATRQGRRFPEFFRECCHAEELQNLEIVSGTPDWRTWLPVMAKWRLRKASSLVTVCSPRHATLYVRLAQRVPGVRAEIVKTNIVHRCPCGTWWPNDSAVRIEHEH